MPYTLDEAGVGGIWRLQLQSLLWIFHDEVV